jgi:ribonuclease HI
MPKHKSQPWEELNVLIKENGEFTEDSIETLEILAEAHYPQPPDNQVEDPIALDTDITGEHKDMIDSIFSKDRMDRIIKKLPSNKAPGLDNVRNNMIVAAWDQIQQPLRHIFKQCLTYTYCPKTWKTSKGIIIPKEGKDDYTKPRAYRIISLTSNIQKLLERAILDYLERDTNIDKKLTKNQFGFRKRKSTEAAIHRLTRKIEDAIQNGQFALGVFLDVEGAFDNIKYSSIWNALNKAKVPPVIANWIREMLNDRSIILELHGYSLKKKIFKGCPQGGILSPLLWNLTLNTLLADHRLNPDFIQAFADDLAILIQGIDLRLTMRDITTRYLHIIDKWCTDNGVKLSAIKTKVIIFSTLRRKYSLEPILLNGQPLELSKEVKYLGVTFDCHLRWNLHIQNKCKQATRLLFMCRNFVAKTWGLSPARMRWLYKQVILPTLSYSCFVWIHRVDETAYLREMLAKVQKLATLQITGGFNKTPNITLDTIAGIMPIDIQLKYNATKTTLRLKLENNWAGQYSLSNKIISHAKFLDAQVDKLNLPSENTLIDKTIETPLLERNYKIILDYLQVPIKVEELNIFTDGSLKQSPVQAGAGFVIYRNGRTISEHSISLGKLATINQCEMVAINNVASLLNTAEMKNQTINIFSDSLNCLLQLNSGRSSSRLTIETVKLLNKLGRHNNLNLIKVKAHVGIVGNERADFLAKKGADTPPIGPEPFLTISWSNIVTDLLKKAREETANRINNHRIRPNAKTPLLSYIGRYGFKLASNNKKHIREITHFFSDQCWLHNSRNKRESIISPFCDHCQDIEETAEHFIGECPAYVMARVQIFGVPYIGLPQIINEFGTNKLIQFINLTGRTNKNYYPDTE